MTSKYLVSLGREKGWNNPTVLVRATSVDDARVVARNLKPNSYIGLIKKVDY